MTGTAAKNRKLNHRFIYKRRETCYSKPGNRKRAPPGKEKDMFAAMISWSCKKHPEQQRSSLGSLDRLFVRSLKAKKNDCVIV